MENLCIKVPKNDLVLKYLEYSKICFVLYIILAVVGILKNFNLYYSNLELLVFLLFLIFNWLYLLGFLIIFIFFNLINIIFVIGVFIQNTIPINSQLFKYCYLFCCIILGSVTIHILFTIRKEGMALLLEHNEGTELEDIPDNKNYLISKNKEKEKNTKPKKGFIPFSGKGTIVG